MSSKARLQRLTQISNVHHFTSRIQAYVADATLPDANPFLLNVPCEATGLLPIRDVVDDQLRVGRQQLLPNQLQHLILPLGSILIVQIFIDAVCCQQLLPLTQIFSSTQAFPPEFPHHFRCFQRFGFSHLWAKQRHHRPQKHPAAPAPAAVPYGRHSSQDDQWPVRRRRRRRQRRDRKGARLDLGEMQSTWMAGRKLCLLRHGCFS